MAAAALPMAVDGSNNPDLVASTADLIEMLEVAIHLILYVRDIYPETLFERRKWNGIAVQMSRHPELNLYIKDVVEAIQPLVIAGQVEQVVVVISDKDGNPVNKFAFNIDPIAQDGYAQPPDDLCAALRALVLKISVLDSMLQPTPAGCTFAVMVTTKDYPQELKQDWIKPPPKTVQNMAGTTVVPLKSVTLGCLHLDLNAFEMVTPTK